MKIKKDFSIKDFNTFSVDVKSRYFVEVLNLDELKEVLNAYPNEKKFILGGGSNTLFVKDWDGIVIKMSLLGKEIEEQGEDSDFVYIRGYAGEDWDGFVNWCIKSNYGGVENMVMIPGTLGGGVTQNIGAYGQGIPDVLEEISVLDLETQQEVVLKPEECGFNYRESNFKNEWMGKYIVLSAVFKLRKNAKTFELGYHKNKGIYGSFLGDLESFVEEPYTLKDVANAVRKQRENKLPSVDEYGTCGSFFKNPVISLSLFEEVQKKVSNLEAYPTEDEMFVKVPAGRILEELGWKGKWMDNVGVFERHALCVVTNKKANGKEILNFINSMKQDVHTKLGIKLEEEVNVITD